MKKRDIMHIACDKLGLTLGELAGKVGKAPSTLSGYRLKRRMPEIVHHRILNLMTKAGKPETFVTAVVQIPSASHDTVVDVIERFGGKITKIGESYVQE